jgi:Fe-S-cluster containining protein
MPPPIHEVLWLSCATKRCCALRTVLPSGADIWRIATRLDVPPESFLRPIPAPPAADDAIALAPPHPPVRAALARRALKGRVSACVFLMQVDGRAARCGLGGLRPLSCRAFPAAGAGGAVRVGDDLPCDCRAWSLADLDRQHVSALLRQAEHERERYRAVIHEWNALAVAPSARVSFGDFCRYLLAAYSAQPPELEE